MSERHTCWLTQQWSRMNHAVGSGWVPVDASIHPAHCCEYMPVSEDGRTTNLRHSEPGQSVLEPREQAANHACHGGRGDPDRAQNVEEDVGAHAGCATTACIRNWVLEGVHGFQKVPVRNNSRRTTDDEYAKPTDGRTNPCRHKQHNKNTRRKCQLMMSRQGEIDAPGTAARQ